MSKSKTIKTSIEIFKIIVPVPEDMQNNWDAGTRILSYISNSNLILCDFLNSLEQLGLSFAKLRAFIFAE